MEIAKELGLIKGGKEGGGGGGGNCGGGGSMCGKSLSEVSMNGGGATTSNFPTGPVFSVGQAAPPGEIHPVCLSAKLCKISSQQVPGSVSSISVSIVVAEHVFLTVIRPSRPITIRSHE